MQEALRDFNKYTSLQNSRNTIKQLSDFFDDSIETPQVGSTEQQFRDYISQLDQRYIRQQQEMFSNMEQMWKQYQEGNEEVNEARKKANQIASELDELQVEKRQVLENIKEKYP